MKNTQYKHNKNWNWKRKISKKEKKEFIEKENKRLDTIRKMKPEQKEKYANNLLSRIQKKSEIFKQLKEILLKEDNLAIADVQERLGINRNTLNYWINMFEKEGWIQRKNIFSKEHKCAEKQGNPKTLVFNKKRLKDVEQYSAQRWKTYEEGQLKTILAEKILREIEKRQPSDKQHQRLIEMFKQFGKEGFGAKFNFLLYDDFIKIDYKLSLTPKGKKALQRKSSA